MKLPNNTLLRMHPPEVTQDSGTFPTEVVGSKEPGQPLPVHFHLFTELQGLASPTASRQGGMIQELCSKQPSLGLWALRGHGLGHLAGHVRMLAFELQVQRQDQVHSGR